MSKHTPGPWTLETVSINYGNGCCHKIGPFPPSTSFQHANYACVYADGVRIGIDENNGVAQELAANARLMTASPDMRAALELTLGWLTNVNTSDPATVGRAVMAALEKSGMDKELLDASAVALVRGPCSMPNVYGDSDLEGKPCPT